jgi:hypothetical protein
VVDQVQMDLQLLQRHQVVLVLQALQEAQLHLEHQV